MMVALQFTVFGLRTLHDGHRFWVIKGNNLVPGIANLHRNEVAVLVSQIYHFPLAVSPPENLMLQASSKQNS